MQEVQLRPRSPRELGAAVPEARLAGLLGGSLEQLRDVLAGGSLINVSSTAVGGGVAEMLRWMLPYSRGAGIDTRWFVIDGNPDLFTVTRRLHHRLQGEPGDDGPLGPAEAEHCTRSVGGPPTSWHR